MTSTGSPQEKPPAAIRPRDAATLIVLDQTTGSRTRVLMGRRRPELVFMPNKFVFPGGRCERFDRTVPAASELCEREVAKLLHDMKGSPSPARARSLALAAIRETYEETGVIIGRSVPSAVDDAATKTPDPSSALDDKNRERTMQAWAGYRSHGVLPPLDQMRFLARAITPPGRPRRFDTRFFFTTTTAVALQIAPQDDELLDVGWHDLDDVRHLDLPNITRAVVEDLCDLIDRGLERAGEHAVPYYYFRNGAFERELITN